jgi:hypothetical protein
MDPSSTIEASTPESPDSGASDQDKNSSSRRIGVGHPRPFSRKSKAGNPHTVTPSAAGPEGGFICKFSENEKICGNTFKLPSDIRFVAKRSFVLLKVVLTVFICPQIPSHRRSHGFLTFSVWKMHANIHKEVSLHSPSQRSEPRRRFCQANPTVPSSSSRTRWRVS